MKRNAFWLVIGLLVLLVTAPAGAATGRHEGEQRQLTVAIDFSKQQGTTITNADGIFYYYLNVYLIGHENKVYPEQYRGSFPMYFFGGEIGTMVTVTNNGPRARTKVRIIAEAHCLNTDGTNGVAIMQPQVTEIELARGETRVIDASYIAQYVAGAESGLDRFTIKVQHVNEGGGPGNAEPALIMIREAILCPPEPGAGD